MKNNEVSNVEYEVEEDGLCLGLSGADAHTLLEYFCEDGKSYDVPGIGSVTVVFTSDSPRITTISIPGMFNDRAVMVDGKTSHPHVRLWDEGVVVDNSFESPVPFLIQLAEAVRPEDVTRQHHVAGYRAAVRDGVNDAV